MAVSESTKTSQKRIGGIGLPVIDFYALEMDELLAGRALIQRLQTAVRHDRACPPQVREAAEQGAAVIDRAITARKELDTFWKEEKRFKPGQKRLLDAEDLPRVEAWFQAMVPAAYAINHASSYLKTDKHLRVRHVGGTLTNKLHTLSAGMGKHADMRVCGLVGEGKGLTVLQRRFAESGIQLEEPVNERLPKFTQNYIVVTPDGDRIIMKSPVRGLDILLEGYEPRLGDCVAGLDTVLIEGSDLSPARFGTLAFTTAAEAAMAGNREIIFAPPTDTSMVLTRGGEYERKSPQAKQLVEDSRALLDRIIDHPNTRVLTMNEAEACAMFLAERYKKLPPEEAHAFMPCQHPQLMRAMEIIQQRLGKKAKALKPGEPEPIAVVSLGVDGAYAITAAQTFYLPCRAAETCVDTLGAGDSFTAGMLVKREEILRAHQTSAPTRPIHFTSHELMAMLRAGQKVSAEVVQQRGAWAPKDAILKALRGANVPTQGTLAAPIAPPTPEHEVQK